MLSAAIYLLTHSLLLSLHLAGNPGSFPKPLSAEEERDCLDRLAKGDMDARNTLVEHNLRLVAHIVKKYYAQESEQDDLISIGTIGLIKGISSFKPEKNTRLATYAARCIENAILPPARFMCAEGSCFSQAAVLLAVFHIRSGEVFNLALRAEEDDVGIRAVPNHLPHQCPHGAALLLHAHAVDAFAEAEQHLLQKIKLCVAEAVLLGETLPFGNLC